MRACWLLTAHTESLQRMVGILEPLHTHRVGSAWECGALGPALSQCQPAVRVKFQLQVWSKRSSKCNSHSQLSSGSGRGWNCPEITPWLRSCPALHPQPLPLWSSWGHIYSQPLSPSSSPLTCFRREPILGHKVLRVSSPFPVMQMSVMF